jgi:molecular chaperone HtpG
VSEQHTESTPFQVHLRGVVELLSRSIYSGPAVYLRELIQNAADAVAARRDEGHRGGLITITPVGPRSRELLVSDDGIGLDRGEVAELLATVGRSSKRDLLDMPRGDRLGQFGIGLLSCFMIADEIRVLTRSARGGDPVEWLGRSDGTFSVRPLSGAEAEGVPVGTQVVLAPRGDDAALAGEDTVLTLARDYAEYLPVPIDVVRADGRATRINETAVFADPHHRSEEELLEYGRELLGTEPLEAIPLSVPATGTTGVAYVLPYAPPPGARQASRVYLGGMLLSPALDDLLPEWGFFVRCVVNTTGLHPTASREGLIDDSALQETRDGLGAALRRWVLHVAATRPATLNRFLAVHHLGLRSVAVHDDELAAMILPQLRFETSAGTSTLRELAAAHPHLRYASTVDEFRQLAPLARPDAPIVNAGHVYDEPLLNRAPEFLDVVVERADASELMDALAEPPLAERATVTRLERRADAALADLHCTVTVRGFAPPEVPALYVTDQEVLGAQRRRDVAAGAGGLWGGLLSRLDSPASVDAPRGKLCLNWNNRLIRTLAGEEHEGAGFSPAVRVLYVQALLAGQHTLTRADRGALTEAMGHIVHLAVGLDAGPGPA